MPTLAEAREALADAVTSAGISCLPYPYEQLSPPQAFIDTISLDYSTGQGQSFCASGWATAQVVVVEQANDRPGAVAALEAWIPLIIKEIENLGVQVTSLATGTTDVNGQSLPASIYNVRFAT